MILKRLITLSALALALSLGLSDRAQAAFTVVTTVTNVLVDGAAPGGGVTLNAAGTITLAGGAMITTTTPYYSFSDGVSTIYLVNDSRMFTTSGSTNEGVFESTPV